VVGVVGGWGGGDLSAFCPIGRGGVGGGGGNAGAGCRLQALTELLGPSIGLGESLRPRCELALESCQLCLQAGTLIIVASPVAAARGITRDVGLGLDLRGRP